MGRMSPMGHFSSKNQKPPTCINIKMYFPFMCWDQTIWQNYDFSYLRLADPCSYFTPRQRRVIFSSTLSVLYLFWNTAIAYIIRYMGIRCAPLIYVCKSVRNEFNLGNKEVAIIGRNYDPLRMSLIFHVEKASHQRIHNPSKFLL